LKRKGLIIGEKREVKESERGKRQTDRERQMDRERERDCLKQFKD
jgi:hypothetical protein